MCARMCSLPGRAIPHLNSAAGSNLASSKSHMTAGLRLSAALLAGSQQPAVPARPADSAEAQKSVSSAPVGTDDEGGDLPVSLERIQRALSRPPAIRLQGERNVYRGEIIGRQPTIEDILGPPARRRTRNSSIS